MLIWHDCKTGPPKQSGVYLLWFIEPNGEDWDKAYYNSASHEWSDLRECVPYGQPDWGWSDSILYMWAEINLLEIK